MVSALIFAMHLVIVIYAFFKYKKEGVGEGVLAVAFIGIIFAVGWTISTMLTNLLFSFDSFERWYWQNIDSWILLLIRKEFSRDTISLVVLTISEAVFYYYFFFRKTKVPHGTDTPEK